MNEVKAATELLAALVGARREMILVGAKNFSDWKPGAIVTLQAEIEAVEAALNDEKRRRDDRRARQREGSAKQA